MCQRAQNLFKRFGLRICRISFFRDCSSALSKILLTRSISSRVLYKARISCLDASKKEGLDLFPDLDRFKFCFSTVGFFQRTCSDAKSPFLKKLMIFMVFFSKPYPRKFIKESAIVARRPAGIPMIFGVPPMVQFSQTGEKSR